MLNYKSNLYEVSVHHQVKSCIRERLQSFTVTEDPDKISGGGEAILLWSMWSKSSILWPTHQT